MSRGTKDNRYTSLSPAVEQAAEILKYLASEPMMKVNLTGISKSVGLHKSKAQSILDALQIGGFVSKDEGNKTYCLGIGLVPVGQRALDNIDYRGVAKPFLEKLARETRCTVLFGVVNDQRLVVIAKESSGLEVDSRVPIGYNRSLFYRGHGKAILAALPESEQEKLLSGSDFFKNDNQDLIPNSKLLQEIVEIRKRGYAIENGSVDPGIKMLSAAVVGHDACPIGVIIIIGFMRKSALARNGAELVEASRKVSAALGGV
jgi:DNA-binding IclR family transcriptional regulator